MNHSPTRKWPAALSALALVLALAMSLMPLVAQARVFRDLENVYAKKATGNILVIGNGNLTCDTDNDKCVRAQNGTIGGQIPASNNGYVMSNYDGDTDPDTFNSSMANLAIPAGSEIDFARLYWAGTTNVKAYNKGKPGNVATTAEVDEWKTIKFGTPDGVYHDLTAGGLDRNKYSDSKDYSAWADVTDLVKEHGTGHYWGANINSSQGQDLYAGWALVVSYINPAEPLRDLRVYDGYLQLINNDEVTQTISGFTTPAAGVVQAEVGSVVWEGDKGYDGDYMFFGGEKLADELSPKDNFFNGTVSTLGEVQTDRDPNYRHTMQLDAKTVKAPDGSLGNLQKSVDVTFASDRDWYYVNVLTTAIDIEEPVFAPVKTVKNLNGNDPARVGDVLEYEIFIENTGADGSTDAVFTDNIPAGTSFVPGSMKTVTADGETAYTDEAGDDQAEYADGTVTIRVGTGADATTGGRIAADESVTVSFQVKVEKDAAETIVKNSASLSYKGVIAQEELTTESNSVSSDVDKLADVAIVKSGPTEAKAGETVTWELDVTNAGPSSADDVVVTDTLPDGATFVSADGCTAEGQVVTCDLGVLEANGATTISIVAMIAEDLDSSDLVNTAEVSTSTPELNSDNNSSSATVTIGQEADLGVTKTVSPTELRPGEQAVWTIEVVNNGPSTATNVAIADTLPDGLTFVSADDPCTEDQGSLSCEWATLASGATKTVTVTTKVASDRAAGDIINTASVSSDTTDSNPDNDSDSATVTVGEPLADVYVTKELTSEVNAGQPVSYSITVGNNGPSVASDVTVTDTLPAELSNAEVSSAECTVTGNDISCSFASLAVGQTQTIQVTADIAPDASGDLANTASVSSGTEDSDETNDSSTVSSTVSRSADLGITKTAGQAVAGQDVTYTLTVTNHGSATATGVQVTDSLPGEFEYVSSSAPGGECEVSGETLTCPVGGLGVDESAQVTVVMHIPSDVADASSVENTASVSGNESDPVEGNNTATAQVATATDADLEIAKTGPDTATPGEKVSWTLTVTNNGPSDAQATTVSDSIPDGVRSVTASSSAGSCSVSDTVTCDLGVVPAGESVTITVSGTLDSGYASDELTNTASVATSTAESTDSNNSASSTSPVVRSADIVVTKTGPDGAVTAGEQITWKIAVSNEGPSDAVNATMNDVLPEGIINASVSTDKGECQIEDNVINCQFGTIIPADLGFVTVTGQVSATYTGESIANTASGSSDSADPNGDNNSSTAETPVERSADPMITKTGPDTVRAGEEITWTLEVTNNGPSSALNTVVTDTLPEGIVSASVSTTAGTCEVVDSEVTCTIGELASDPVTITMTGQVDPAFAGDELVNNASVSSDTSDSDTSNNDASATTQVTRAADLAVAKTGSLSTVSGEAISWTVEVTNNGPSLAEAATLADTLPEGVVDPSVETDLGTCEITDAELACGFGDMAVDAKATVTITATVDPAYADDEMTNMATASSTTDDPNPDNNSDSATTSVTRSADLSIVKTGTESAKAGESISWTLEVANAGPSTAVNTTVSDKLPEGVGDNPEISSTAGECEIIDRTVVCQLGDLGVDDTVTITINAVADSSFAGDEILNSADVSSQIPDPDESNNGSDATTTLGRSADLSVSKAGPASVVAGEQITWTLEVVNNGPSDAIGATVTDEIPAGVENATATATVGECTVDASVSCNLGDVASGDSVTITITGDVPASFAGDELMNSASVSSDTEDSNADNDSSSVTTSVTRSADVSIVKTGTESANAGEAISWTLVVSNDGPSDARSVLVVDTVPEGVGDDVTVSSDAGECTVADGEITCELGTLAVGSSATIMIDGVADADFAGEEILNSASVSSTTPDPDESNNGADARTSVTRLADVSIVKVATESANAGEAIHFTMTVSNAGPSYASDVTITDMLPEGVEGATVTTSAGTCEVVDGAVSCQLGTLAVGAEVQVAVDGMVDSGFAGDLIANEATVSSTTADPNEDNNTSSSETAITHEADLSIVKTGTESAQAGEAVSWTLTVSNEGPSAAMNTVVTDTLPEGVADATVSTDVGECSVVDREVTCELGTLAVDSSVTITVDAVSAADFAGEEILNTASVGSDATDPNEENNSSSATTTVGSSADLSIVKTATASVVAGEQVTWTLNVTNNGPSVARDTVVTDPLPAGAVNATVASEAGQCEIAAQIVECEMGTVDAGASAEITITAAVVAGYEGDEMVNTASVSSTTTDPNEDNNSSSTTTEITRSADLALIKTSSDTGVAGEWVSWTFTITNNGPSVATDVELFDVVPMGIDDVEFNIGAADQCGLAGQEFSCHVPSIAPGETVEIGLMAQLSPGHEAGELPNEATVSAATPDPDMSNNTDDAIIIVSQAADLSIVKTGTESANAGEEIGWTLEVTNAGPSVARNAVVTDTLPVGVGGEVVVTTDAGECMITARDITCELGDLAPEQTAIITINGTTDAGFAGETILNSAEVSSETPDPDETNNGGSSTTVLTRSADLAIVKSGTAAMAGEKMTWTLDVVNAGPSIATGTIVTDTLPEGIAEGAMAMTTYGACQVTGLEVSCDLGMLKVDQNVQITIEGTVLPGYTGETLSNTATISSETPDPNEDNNSSSAVVPVGAVADLAVTKNGPERAQAGEKVSWTFEIANNGPATAADVLLTDTLPTGVTYVDASGDMECTAKAQVVTCSAATLEAGATAQLTITGMIGEDVSGSITNHAEVSSATTEDPATMGDNEDDATTKVSAKPPVPFGPDMPHTGASVMRLMAFTAMILTAGIVLIAMRRRMTRES